VSHYILNIETSTKNCSVSVTKNGKLLTLKEINNGNYSHAEKLHPLIEAVLIENNIAYKDLKAIAVGKGPGSFTGLRIGVSAAKGLCFALNIPLIAINSLEILAHAIDIQKGFIISLIDARRMEVYASVYTSKFEQIENIQAKIIDKGSFQEYLAKGNVHFVGDGAEKLKALCSQNTAKFYTNLLPSARDMAKLSYYKYKKNDIEDVAYFEPFYLKDFLIVKSKKVN